MVQGRLQRRETTDDECEYRALEYGAVVEVPSFDGLRDPLHLEFEELSDGIPQHTLVLCQGFDRRVLRCGPPARLSRLALLLRCRGGGGHRLALVSCCHGGGLPFAGGGELRLQRVEDFPTEGVGLCLADPRPHPAAESRAQCRTRRRWASRLQAHEDFAERAEDARNPLRRPTTTAAAAGRRTSDAGSSGAIHDAAEMTKMVPKLHEAAEKTGHLFIRARQLDLAEAHVPGLRLRVNLHRPASQVDRGTEADRVVLGIHEPIVSQGGLVAVDEVMPAPVDRLAVGRLDR
mmetsp:Transcript_9671/g.25303  ORF Transcript_9671/g.25303 Transcript_9671/m.25303 type:complete len:290 (+) Transcript_9671:915-1784(+)